VESRAGRAEALDMKGAPSAETFHELDGMRGVLAGLVMLHHLGLNEAVSRWTGGRVVDGAWGLSVDFFFILSGFVLSRSLKLRPVTPVRFIAKRLFRLYPLYIFSTLLILIVQGPEGRNLLTIAANVLAVQSILFLDSINFPSWSVPMEVFIPMAFLIVVGRLGRSRILALVTLVACGAILARVSWVVAGQASWFVAGGGAIGLVRGVFGLIGGAALFAVWAGSESGPPRASVLISTGCFGLAVLVMALAGVRHELAAAFPLLAMGAIAFGAGANGLFSTRPFTFLGKTSYSIYLMHVPVITISWYIIGTKFYASGNDWKMLMVLPCVAVAAMTYHYVERPFIERMRQAPKPEDAARGKG
jgi:peptidoglycan/LPS O-acetylase OafA/YrhL